MWQIDIVFGSIFTRPLQRAVDFHIKIWSTFSIRIGSWRLEIKKQFSTEEIFSALARARAGQRFASLATELGVCEHTLYDWKKKYGRMSLKQLQTLRGLERENRVFKKLLNDQTHQIEVLNFVIRKTAALKGDRAEDLIRQIQDRFTVSTRSAIRYLGLNRSTFFYRHRRNVHIHDVIHEN
jgi:putative transposase